jgi:hypothetical protein
VGPDGVPEVAPDDEILDPVEPAQQVPELVEEGGLPRGEVLAAAAADQALVAHQLERRLEQQRGDRFGAAQPALGHVLPPEPEGPADHLAGVGQRAVVGQHVGHDPVGLDERPHQHV